MHALMCTVMCRENKYNLSFHQQNSVRTNTSDDRCVLFYVLLDRRKYKNNTKDTNIIVFKNLYI
ncbi:uncharacterized protein LOC144478742 isoform X2 [Augochlora pura]